MKHIRWLIAILIIVAVCGSIFILPHFLSRHVIDALTVLTSVRITDPEGLRTQWGAIRFRSVSLLFPNDVISDCTDLVLNYAYHPVTTDLPLRITSATCAIHPLDREQWFLGIGPLKLTDVLLKGTIERNEQLIIENAVAHTDFGSITAAGVIKHDQEVNLLINFFIRNYVGELFAAWIQPEEKPTIKDLAVEMTITGRFPRPDISVTSDLFTFHLKGRE